MHPRISISSICFMRDSLSQQAQYWRELGATRVSLVAPQIDSEGEETARQVLASGDYALETIMHPFLPGQTLDPDPHSWAQPRAQLQARIEQAQRLGARSIYMVTGGRGDLTWEQAADTFSAAIEPCIESAKEAGIQLMIENAPAAYADIHIAHTLRDSLTLIHQAGIDQCVDLPTCWTEAGLDQLIREAVPRCGLVQVGDYVCGDRSLPARAVPGDGDIPLKRLLGWLLEAGYEGTFELELLGPRIDEEGALNATRRAAQRLGDLLQSLDA